MIHSRVLRLIATVVLLLAPGLASALCAGNDLRDTLPAALVEQASANVEAVPLHRGLAFEASRGDTRITLFGTVHLSDSRVVIPDEIADRIDRADLLLVEVTAADRDLFQQQVLGNPTLLFDFEGPGLSTHLTETEWETLSEHLSGLGTPLELAEFLRPWFVVTLLELPLCEVSARRAGALALDERIEALAVESAIAVAGLDDATEVLAFFIEAPEETQLDVLRVSLAGTAADAHLVETAIATWLEQEPMLGSEIVRLESRSLAEDAAAVDEVYRQINHYLVVERNRAWLAKILDHAEEAVEMVVAVGAAHLPGVDGLVNLLQQEGFAISPVALFQTAAAAAAS